MLTESLSRAAEVHHLSETEIAELQLRLGYLAFNDFNAACNKPINQTLAAAWFFHIGEQSNLENSDPEPEVSAAVRMQAAHFLQLTVKIGWLATKNEIYWFPDEDLRAYFCAYYCHNQPLTLELVERTERKVWPVWTTLDNNLPKKLIELLKYTNGEETRNNIGNALGYIGTQQVVDLLIELLKDKNTPSEVRQTAIEALGYIRNQCAVPALIEALTDSNVDIRWLAASALGQIEDQRAVIPLIASLKDAEAVVRRYAAYSLSDLGDTQAVPALIAALEYPDSGFSAASALGILNDRQATPALIEALVSDSAKLRAEAAQSLGEFGDKKAIEPLATLLSDSDSEVRFWAAWALGQLGDSRAFEPLKHTLTTLEPRHFGKLWRAVEALGNLGDSRALELIIPLARHGHPMVRRAVVESLGKLGDNQIIPLFCELLIDKAASVRASAAMGLAQVGGKEALQILIELSKVEDSGETFSGEKVSEVIAKAIEKVAAE